MRGFGLAIAALCTLLLSGCGYNELQRRDEQVKAAWAEVLNQYQRRADLVPNLVNTVKGYAAQEQQVLRQVTEARARAGSIQATPELVDNPEAFARFQAAQAELTSALSRLLAVAENYPQLKSDALFRGLGAAPGSAAHGAGHRPDRDAHGRAEGRARTQAARARVAQGQPDRGFDRAEHCAGNRRAVRAARRRGVEARAQGYR